MSRRSSLGWGTLVAVHPPVANSYNFVPVRDFRRARGEPCPLSIGDGVPFERGRSLVVRLRDRMRLVRTTTGDFGDDALAATKDVLGQIYADVSTKLAPDDFARDLRKMRPSAECDSCARKPRCPGAWEAVGLDVFSRDDARVHAILASLSGRVLDVGGGEARYLDHLSRREVEVVVVDPDAQSLAVLASRDGFARPVVACAEELPADLGLFDHVLFLRSYNHLRDPRLALAGAVARLRAGGTLLVVDNVAFGLVRLAEHAARAEAAPENRIEHYRNDGSAEAAALVAGSDFAGDLRLIERRDVGPETSNQWLLRYERVARDEMRA
jgi:SAM-dependent methyltransferase